MRLGGFTNFGSLSIQYVMYREKIVGNVCHITRKFCDRLGICEKSVILSDAVKSASNCYFFNFYYLTFFM